MWIFFVTVFRFSLPTFVLHFIFLAELSQVHLCTFIKWKRCCSLPQICNCYHTVTIQVITWQINYAKCWAYQWNFIWDLVQESWLSWRQLLIALFPLCATHGGSSATAQVQVLGILSLSSLFTKPVIPLVLQYFVLWSIVSILRTSVVRTISLP